MDYGKKLMRTFSFLERLLPNRSPEPDYDMPGVHPQGKAEFVVIGLGRFGTSVAKALTQYGHGVLALDRDPVRVQQLASDLPHVVALDATNIDALREVGVGAFDTGVSCIGTDFESNLLATVLMRRLGVKRIFAKARTRTQRTILQQVGADEVILPEHEAGVRLARRLAAIDFVDYLSLGDDSGVVELLLPERYHGMTLAQAAIRRVYNLTVIAVRRDGKVISSPGPDFHLLPGDELLVLGAISDAERLV